MRYSKINTSDVRLGSKADIGAGPRDVRFTQKSGHSTLGERATLSPVERWFRGRPQYTAIEKNHAPAATSTMPAREAIRRPNGVTFSKRISSASTAIQSGFVTPAMSNTAIRAQQQPTQYAPWRSPSISEPGASLRKPPCLIRNANGFWHWARPVSYTHLTLPTNREV